MIEVMNRRQAIRRVTVAGVATCTLTSAALLEEGCNTSQWLTVALNDLPTVLQIATSIIAIIGAASGASTAPAVALANSAAQKAKDAITEAQTFLTQYQANKTTTLLGNVDDALTVAQSQLGSILSILNITDPKWQATLSAGISAALVIIVAVQTLIPAPVPATPTPAASRRAQLSKVTATNQSIAIKVGYNEALASAGGSQFAIA
jgi:hypothetical protein